MVKIISKKVAPKGSNAVSLIDKVVGLIKDSETGMTTDELRSKTDMTNKQLWSITSRAAKFGKIKTMKRGGYLPV